MKYLRIKTIGVMVRAGKCQAFSGFTAFRNLLVVLEPESSNSPALSTGNTVLRARTPSADISGSAGLLVLVLVRNAMKKESGVIFGECVEIVLFLSSIGRHSLGLSQLFG